MYIIHIRYIHIYIYLILPIRTTNSAFEILMLSDHYQNQTRVIGQKECALACTRHSCSSVGPASRPHL